MSRIRDGWLRSWGIEACGLVLVLSLLLAPAAFAQGAVIHLKVRQTATQSLTLIKPSDPTFEGTLDANYPGLSDEAGYETSIRPFLVLVRNDSSLVATAYAITWAVHYANGQVGNHRAMFVNRPLMYREGMTLLRPGDIRLIAPMYNVTPKDYEQYQSFAQFYPAKVYPGSDGLTSVDVAVDGVVYSDGTFIGPDKTRILLRSLMARFAARDELLAAQKLIQSYSVPALYAVGPLLQALNQHVQAGLKAHQSTLLAMYVRARGRSAGDLERILPDEGITGLEAVLQSRVGGAAGNVSPSVFGSEYQNLSNNDPRVFGTAPLGPSGLPLGPKVH